MEYNKLMSELISRSPVRSSFNIPKRFQRAKLKPSKSDDGNLRLAMTSTPKMNSGHIVEARLVDRDVPATRIDLSRHSETNYSSACFTLIWAIVQNTNAVTEDYCGLVSIIDDKLARRIGEHFIEPASGCYIAFYRGEQTQLFDDIRKSIGANAVVTASEMKAIPTRVELAAAINRIGRKP